MDGRTIGLGIAIIAAIVIIYELIAHIAKYVRAKALKPTAMVCIHCGSHNVKIQKEVEGITSQSISSYYGRWGVGTRNSVINRTRIVVCGDCGYDFPFIDQSMITEIRKRTKAKMRLWILITILAVLVEPGIIAILMK